MKATEFQALRFELERVISNARIPQVELERLALLYHHTEEYLERYGEEVARKIPPDPRMAARRPAGPLPVTLEGQAQALDTAVHSFIRLDNLDPEHPLRSAHDQLHDTLLDARRCETCGEVGRYVPLSAMETGDNEGTWEHVEPTDHFFKPKARVPA